MAMSRRTTSSDPSTPAAPGPLAGDGVSAMPPEDGPPPTPAEGLALIEEQHRRAEGALDIDARLVLGAWGASWFLGFLLLWVASPARTEPLLRMSWPLAGALFGGLLVAAAVVTGVHIAMATRGIRGTSTRAGAMYGWSWLLGFLGLAAIMTAVGRLAVSPQVEWVLWPALSGLVVALLYLAGGALWQDTVQYGMGAWILVVSAAGAWAGAPGNYLVMSLAGGGCFLLAAAGYAVASSRRGVRRAT